MPKHIYKVDDVIELEYIPMLESDADWLPEYGEKTKCRVEGLWENENPKSWPTRGYILKILEEGAKGKTCSISTFWANEGSKLIEPS